MKKLICFSLWGDHEFYNYGALENALIAKELYPDWICRYYYLDNCNKKVIEELNKLDNVELIKMTGSSSNSNAFWRFEPAFEEEDIIFISRDTDSRLNTREKKAVDEWLNSDKDFHIMRDHSLHTTEILAGMWGCRNNILKPFREYYKNFMRSGKHGEDQTFLTNLYPYLVEKSIIHASYYKLEKNCLNFPESDYKSFVGSYVRTAPKTFKLLKEDERLLNVVLPHQAIYC